MDRPIRTMDRPITDLESDPAEAKRRERRRRFEANAKRRTVAALAALRRLRQVANRRSYEYEEWEAEQIVDALAQAQRELAEAFYPPSPQARDTFDFDPPPAAVQKPKPEDDGIPW